MNEINEEFDERINKAERKENEDKQNEIERRNGER